MMEDQVMKLLKDKNLSTKRFLDTFKSFLNNNLDDQDLTKFYLDYRDELNKLYNELISQSKLDLFSDLAEIKNRLTNSDEVIKGEFNKIVNYLLVDITDIDLLINSLLNSISFIHFTHLITKSYAKHIALQEYYEGMPALVDALAETYLVHRHLNPLKVNNTIKCPIKYLSKLKKLAVKCKNNEVNKPLEALIDDIIKLIDSTLYKLNQFK